MREPRGSLHGGSEMACIPPGNVQSKASKLKTRVGPLGVRLLWAALFISHIASPSDALENDNNLGIYWRSFRSLHPLQLQEVVVSRPKLSTHRYVLVSDPPPHIMTPTLGRALEQLFGNALIRYEIFKHEIGVDGWIKDIGIELDDTQWDEQVFEAKFLELSRWLYKTDYKAYLTYFDAKPWLDDLSPRRGLAPPDMRVSAASLNAWFRRKIACC
jgi:hypothetical protein